MIERISKKYAMTEKGARDYVAAVFWSALVNISKMLPVGVLATALSGIVEALTNGTDPKAGLARFLISGVLALTALFVTCSPITSSPAARRWALRQSPTTMATTAMSSPSAII